MTQISDIPDDVFRKQIRNLSSLRLLSKYYQKEMSIEKHYDIFYPIFKIYKNLVYVNNNEQYFYLCWKYNKSIFTLRLDWTQNTDTVYVSSINVTKTINSNTAQYEIFVKEDWNSGLFYTGHTDIPNEFIFYMLAALRFFIGGIFQVELWTEAKQYLVKLIHSKNSVEFDVTKVEILNEKFNEHLYKYDPTILTNPNDVDVWIRDLDNGSEFYIIKSKKNKKQLLDLLQYNFFDMNRMKKVVFKEGTDGNKNELRFMYKQV